MTFSFLSEATLSRSPLVDPKSTLVAVLRCFPLMVTVVPPAVGPELGATLLITGLGGFWTAADAGPGPETTSAETTMLIAATIRPPAVMPDDNPAGWVRAGDRVIARGRSERAATVG